MLLMVTMAARLPTGDAFAGAATAITLTAMAALSVASGMSSALETLIAAAFGADEFSVHISRFLYAATAVNIGLLYLPIAVACVAPWLRALLPGASDPMLEALVLWLRWAPLPMLPQVFSMGLQKFAICQRRPAVVTRSAAVSLVCLPLLLWLAARGGGDEGLTRKSSEEGARGMFDGFGGGGSLLAFLAAITADKTIMLLALVGSILRDDVLRRNVWGHGGGGVHVHASLPHTGLHSGNGHNTPNNQRQHHYREREEEELGERSALISGNRSARRPHQQPRPRREAEACGRMGVGGEGDHDATADNTTEEGMLIEEALGRLAHGRPLHTASEATVLVHEDANDGDGNEEEGEEGLRMSRSGSSRLRPFGFYVVSYLRVGYPSAIAFCIDTWTFELMTILSARCGPTQAAAWVLMQQLTSPIFALAAGLSSAAAADVGQALGAGCAPSTVTRRVRIVVYSSVAIGAATLVAVLLFGAPLFSALVAMAEGSRPTTTAGGSPSSASTYSSTMAAAIGVEAMPLFAVHLATDVPFFALQGVYRGLGRQGLQAKLVFVSLWVIAVPLAALWPRLFSALLAQLGGGESASTDGKNHLFGLGMGGGCVQGIVVGLVAGTAIGSLLLYRCLDASAYTLLLADASPSPTATPGSGGFFGGWRQRSPSDGGDGDGDISVEGGGQAKTTLDRCFHGALRKIQMMRGSQSVAGVGDSAAYAAPTAATPHRRDGGPPPSPPIAFATTRGGISFGTKGNALRDDMANSINRREHKY